ncbi:MAG TPA: arylsulfatase [Polyangiales bacterium]|nr:arylsulfatase [Polyangiales bacterium]
MRSFQPRARLSCESPPSVPSAHLRKRQATVAALLLLAFTSGASAQSVLPHPDPIFDGKIQRTLEGSKAGDAAPLRPPAGAPNVLIVLVDDAGFGNPSTFGGPVQTPSLDALAEGGLRYNRFHVTGLCSPTRAALLSGRNHHSVGFGMVSEVHSDFPGYNAHWPKSAASLARILRDNGYSTAAIGKWHLTPDDEQGAAGPFDRWPNAMGFDYFWGFLGGEDSHYDSMIVENNSIVGVPTEKDFYLTTAMADQAIDWLRNQKTQSPERPFFLYFATGASHAPHHVAKHWADKYEGQFDEGWDALREATFARQKKLGVIPEDAKLTPRPDAIPAWDSLSPEEQKLFARQMEVYAGFQECTDHEIGRVLGSLDAMGLSDDTLVIYIFGDNGASLEGSLSGSFNEMTVLNGIPLTMEQQFEAIKAYGGIEVWGGPRTAPHYAAGWAWAGDTPFQWGKQVASHLGGTRNPMVVSWPGRIKELGGLRSQFTHATDIAPTILEVAGLPVPDVVDGTPQTPMHGVSFANSFSEPDAPEHHRQQYFETVGNRAMYKDGWIWSCRVPRIPWQLDPETIARFAPGRWNPEDDPCELYDLENDFSQAEDLSSEHPDKMRELEALFWKEAESNQVLPLFGGLATLWGMAPPGNPGPKRATFYPGVQNVAQGMIPQLYNRSFTITADLEIERNWCAFSLCYGADGVIVANASFLGGFSLYVQGGKLRYTYSFLGLKVDDLIASERMPTGKVQVRYEFTADKPGEMATGGTHRLFVAGKQVAEGKLEHTVPVRFSGHAGLDIGRDNGLPVSPNKIYYLRAPFPFEGTIEQVVFEVQ